jgi:hypothetical protein
VIATAVLCPAPPLLIRSVTGADPVVPELRQACLDAVTTLVGRGPDLISVVGVAGQTRRWDGSAQLNVAADMMATGRAAWRVLAGAMHGVQMTSHVWYCGDPFGVAYLVASMTAGRTG